MPTYTATADIYNVLSSKIVAQLTDDTNGTEVNTDFVDDALERAESIVDSYVGKVYSVPLSTPVEKSIVHAVVTLAKCMLYRRRNSTIPDEVESECEKVTEWLKEIAASGVELDDEVTTDDAIVAEQNNDPEVFTAQVFGR
ncbi:hypothetical protein LCGC14_3071010 [marine sediment metagenome]|uniref:DUF1320 domain-containing protein n=1 Tax=marine sediment metagenome TaxID=412755 RepID=A0A0F8WG22_9ZZZZ